MKYNLIGKRYLRKYTAEEPSPSYNATTDAQTVVEKFCDVGWTPSEVRNATITSHTSEAGEDGVSGLDANVLNRESFDAALFCAEHVGGNHRAYANAACYRYRLPEGELPRLTRLSASVTSDPYNSVGARLVIVTNDTGEIPTDCQVVRGEVQGGIRLSGVAKRITREIPAGSGKNYWYPNTETAVFETGDALPSGGLQLRRYLFLFVLLENYNTVRGNWLEGSSHIRNLVEIETDAAMPEWSDGETEDLSATPANEMRIARDGILPYIPEGSPSGERRTAVRTDANPVIESDGSQTPVRTAAGDAASAAVSLLYSSFYSGSGSLKRTEGPTAASGAAFNVTRKTEPHVREDSTRPEDTEVVEIVSSALVVPFAFPRDFKPSTLLLSFEEPSLSPGARFNVFLAEGYLTSLTEEQLKSPGLYDGRGAPFQLLGTVEGGSSAKFPLPATAARTGTVVITGWLPPDRYDVTSGGRQGTGPLPFLPDISITD